MALADAAVGMNAALKEILKRRLFEQQQAFQNQRLTAGDAREQQQLDATLAMNKAAMERQGRIDAETAQQHQYSAANTLADQIPEETFLPQQDAAVAAMQKGGRGSLLTPTPAVPAMGPDFTGPMQNGMTPQQAQVGRPQGFLKTGSASQINTRVDNEANAAKAAEAERDKREDNARLDRSLGIQERNAASMGQSRELSAQVNELKVQAERDKLTRAQADQDATKSNAQTATQTALDLTDRLEKHPGFGMAYGNVSSRLAGFSQPAVDAGSVRDQLVAALALPHLGTLKGPLSDKDILFLKQVSSRLSNPRISEPEARKAIAEAKVFLTSKLSQPSLPGPELTPDAEKPGAFRVIARRPAGQP